MWMLAHRFTPRAVRLADRHYSRQKPGTPQFVRPGSNVVLVTKDGAAVWASVRQKYVDHAWPGAWECVIFRNEGGGLSSVLIREAVAATRFMWGDPLGVGMLTFVDPSKVRHKRDPGRCFLRAGFVAFACGLNGKLVFLMEPDAMPAAEPPIGATARLAV